MKRLLLTAIISLLALRIPGLPPTTTRRKASIFVVPRHNGDDRIRKCFFCRSGGVHRRGLVATLSSLSSALTAVPMA